MSCVHSSPWNDPFPALPAAQYDDVNGHSELLIERVSKEDSGTYVCSAENTVGSIKAIGFVYVKGTWSSAVVVVAGQLHVTVGFG